MCITDTEARIYKKKVSFTEHKIVGLNVRVNHFTIVSFYVRVLCPELPFNTISGRLHFSK